MTFVPLSLVFAVRAWTASRTLCARCALEHVALKGAARKQGRRLRHASEQRGFRVNIRLNLKLAKRGRPQLVYNINPTLILTFCVAAPIEDAAEPTEGVFLAQAGSFISKEDS